MKSIAIVIRDDGHDRLQAQGVTADQRLDRSNSPY